MGWGCLLPRHPISQYFLPFQEDIYRDLGIDRVHRIEFIKGDQRRLVSIDCIVQHCSFTIFFSSKKIVFKFIYLFNQYNYFFYFFILDVVGAKKFGPPYKISSKQNQLNKNMENDNGDKDFLVVKYVPPVALMLIR